MASFLNAYIARGIDYHGRDHDANELLKYLRRTTRLNYRLEDLENVCEFLRHFPKESKLTRKLVQRGLKTNPESAILHLVAAGVELSNPAAIWRPDVRGHLQEALRLAEASTRRREMLMVPKIKQMLSVHNELYSRFAGLPFAAPGGIPAPSGKPGSIEDFLRVFLEAADDDEVEDEEEKRRKTAGPRPFADRFFPAFRRTSRRSRREPKSGS